MTDLVDRMGGDTGAQGEATNPDNTGEGKGRDAQSRINQLVKERNQAREAWTGLQQDFGTVKEELAELRGRIASTTSGEEAGEGGDIRSWSDVPDGQLGKAFQMGVQSENPEAAYQAIVERVRRDLSKNSEEVLQRGRTEHQQAQYRSQVDQRIANDFGDAATSTDSPLFERAIQYAEGFKQRYGKDAIEQMPDLAHTAFMLADRDVNSGVKDRLAQLEQENMGYKRRLSMEPGMPPGAQRPTNEFREHLQKGDVKSALRNLRSVRSFDE